MKISKIAKYFTAKYRSPLFEKGTTVYICSSDGKHLKILFQNKQGEFIKGLLKENSMLVGDINEKEVEQEVLDRINN